MSKLVSTEITDLKAEFEGGASLSVDWYGILRRAANRMLGQIYPETLKRRTNIYGGLSKDLFIYYCPTDVLVPGDLFPNTGERQYTYMPPAQFYANPTSKTFTIEYINKVRFLVVRHASNPAELEIDSMEAIGTITGTATSIALNEYDYLEGTGAIQAVFTDAGLYIGDSFATALDITDYLNGIAIVPLKFTDASKISSVQLRLQTSASAYYSVISTADSIGDSFIDGWNLVRFALANKSTTGSPDVTNIASWRLYITMTSGQTQTIIIDRISIQKAVAHIFEYYSNLVFLDGTTGAFKLTPVAGDSINLDRDAESILHYEACRLVGRPSVSGFNFEAELKREYDQYWLLHPSSAKPLTYSVMPDIPVAIQTDLPDVIGISEPAEEGDTSEGINFADNETPAGTINGTNATFTLANTPNPASSLMVWLNGVFQTQGVDYTLSGLTITFVTPPSGALAGFPFIAYYRY